MSFLGIRIVVFYPVSAGLAAFAALRRGKPGPGAHVAQPVERVLGKDEVISSILIMGSIFSQKLEIDDTLRRPNR